MERLCPKCGNLVNGNGKFCPNCGSELPVVSLNKSENSGYSQQTNYTGGNYANSRVNGYNNNSDSHAAPMPDYPRNTAPADNSDMSLKEWVITILLTNIIPIVSLVITIVWAFSSDTPITKKRYCQALLIYQCFMIAISIVLSVFILIIGVGCAVGRSDLMNTYDYWQF